MGHELYNIVDYDITGYPTICMDIKIVTEI